MEFTVGKESKKDEKSIGYLKDSFSDDWFPKKEMGDRKIFEEIWAKTCQA
jgi:hypothetical protein